MGILDWLLRRAPTIETPAPDIRSVGILVEMRIPLDDPPETHQPETAPDSKTTLSDLFCAIEYADAQGNESRRRVTMRQLVTTNGKLMLQAICHERRAFRSFRVDRISAVITEDGEVLDPGKFFARFAGTDIGAGAADDQTETVAHRLRDFLRPALAVLVCAARADDHLHQTELDAILSFAETESIELHRSGRLEVKATLEAIDNLAPMISAMRVQASSLRGYLLKVIDYDPDRLDRLARALNKVVQADGKLLAAEVAFVHEMNTLANTAIAERWRGLGFDPMTDDNDIFWLR